MFLKKVSHGLDFTRKCDKSRLQAKHLVEVRRAIFFKYKCFYKIVNFYGRYFILKSKAKLS